MISAWLCDLQANINMNNVNQVLVESASLTTSCINMKLKTYINVRYRITWFITKAMYIDVNQYHSLYDDHN